MIGKDAFPAVVRQIGQRVEIWRDGAKLGEGYAYLRPVQDRQDQFRPTDLGLRRRERTLCYGQAELPLDPAPGETLVKAGAETYRVLSARAMRAGARRVFWQALLEWREEAAG